MAHAAHVGLHRFHHGRHFCPLSDRAESRLSSDISKPVKRDASMDDWLASINPPPRGGFPAPHICGRRLAFRGPWPSDTALCPTSGLVGAGARDRRRPTAGPASQGDHTVGVFGFSQILAVEIKTAPAFPAGASAGLTIAVE